MDKDRLAAAMMGTVPNESGALPVMTDPDDRREGTRYQFMQIPKWLMFSGAWQAFGRKRTLADVYRALIMIDHSTDGLDSRRHGDDKRTFACPLEDLALVAGCNVRTAGRAAQELAEIGLLESYKPGLIRAWSHFRIDRGRIITLYRYVAPKLRKIHGGIQDREAANPNDNALADTRIYGVENGELPAPIYIDGLELLKLWKTRPEEPEWPDQDAVAKILGM